MDQARICRGSKDCSACRLSANGFAGRQRGSAALAAAGRSPFRHTRSTCWYCPISETVVLIDQRVVLTNADNESTAPLLSEIASRWRYLASRFAQLGS
jgi:hypothetical protein